MGATASVGDCMSCGALYTRYPGDGGVCAECRDMPAAGVAWEPAQTSPRPAPAPAPRPAAAPRRIGPAPRPAAPGAPRARSSGGRGIPRLAIGALAALLLAGSAGWWIGTNGRTLSRWWRAIRRDATGAWVAVRSRLPFDETQRKEGGPDPASRSTVRDGTPSRGAHRRDKGR